MAEVTVRQSRIVVVELTEDEAVLWMAAVQNPFADNEPQDFAVLRESLFVGIQLALGLGVSYVEQPAAR